MLDMCRKLRDALPLVSGIVLHAEAIIDPANWLVFEEQLLVENADGSKSTGRTLDEFQMVMKQLPRARVCFDLAHVHQVDPTLIEARRMLRVFGSRIAQYHLSQLDHACRHFGLTHSIVERFQTLVPLLPKAPVILESCVPPDEIGRQLALAHRCFEAPNAASNRWTTAAE